MKITANVPTEIEISAIRCVLAVRYGDDDMPSHYPHRNGDMWDVTIDIETGQIRDWPKGVAPLFLHMKVCDCGSYYLLSGDAVVAERERDYVPGCIPGKYGDYIEFEIDQNGMVTNWDCQARNIVRDFFPVEE